ncbi:MAG: sigma-54-dependent Fis family transcriptional regulator [Planctomycetales bacterium]|nr:sigma-54-dependent Fis family transcriptional regulator [Planctomycetales bacterium]
MVQITTTERRLARLLADLAYCNPFRPERLALEEAALGSEFRPEESIAWNRSVESVDGERPNVVNLTRHAEALVERMREAFSSGIAANDEMGECYADIVSYVLYYRHMASLRGDALLDLASPKSTKTARLWRVFRDDYERFLAPLATVRSNFPAAEHLFACFYQVRRGFHYIFEAILGDSLPAAQLRATVWESIFTHDMRRYRRTLYDRMRDLSTLITGPSGTGKELVARAIGHSQYVAFDTGSERFEGQPGDAFLALNLSAFSPTLIESELFGHCKGAYTGALADRQGWLESCPYYGAVFLDEIGELDLGIQVKLLRVVQSRQYSRLGETTSRHFSGKIIAATNRKLAEEIRCGRFREDLYYRLCSDRIETPALRDHLADRPEALRGWVAYLAQRLAGDAAGELADEAVAWIEENLGAEYDWPGNIRELEQCVRSILIRKDYPAAAAVGVVRDEPCPPEWLRQAMDGKLTAEQLVSAYCAAVYQRLGSYQQTAHALGLDRRTVRSKIEALDDGAAAATTTAPQGARHNEKEAAS